MQIRVRHDIDDLANDMAAIARGARSDMVKVVRQGLIVGNTVARDNAKRTAGKHGKHYPKAMTWEMHGASLFGAGGSISGEYGPNPGRPQGRMSFEWGSRNQPPHLDLNRSADLIGGSFAREVRGLPDKWFW